MKSEKQLSNKTIFGYSFGAMADAASYNFIVMYMLFFLTVIVGMSAGKAGLIISVATAASAIYGLIIGPASDATKCRIGRRRPYLFAGAIILFVGLSLLFRPLNLSGGNAFAYYLILLIFVWIGYGTFLGPYNALGAELTTDYNERTKLRTPAAILNCVGNIIGISLPLTMVAFFAKRGASDGQAWNYFAIILGIACLAAILITFWSTKGRDIPPEATMEKRVNPIKDYWEIIRLKPFKWIILICVLFGIGYMAFQSGLIYYVLFFAGMTEAQMSSAMFINIFVSMAITVVVSALAGKINKNMAMAVCFFFSALGMIILYFIGVKSFGMLLVLLAIFGFGNAAFWLLIYPVVYDISEVYEYKYGKRKEGTILSVYAFIFTLASSLGMQVLTTLLTMVGYDPALPQQNIDTVNGIADIVFGVPIAAFVLGGLVCIAYPVSKKTYEKLLEQLDNKKNEKETDESELKRVV